MGVDFAPRANALIVEAISVKLQIAGQLMNLSVCAHVASEVILCYQH